MTANPAPPTIAEVERIINIPDAVLRNLQITLCYHDLSAVLASQTGALANWCTFATWASKQAGQTIRKEDLKRTLERYLFESAAAQQANAEVAAAASIQAGSQAMPAQAAPLSAVAFTSAIDRASDAVARGNRKVFAEIGLAFANFYHSCFLESRLDPQKVSPFCQELRPGEPPDGQGYLRQAFTHYGQALLETDAKGRAEWLLLANIEIGFHEQTRLQPEIAESLDAGLTSFLELARSLFRSLFPLNGWLHLAHLYLRRLIGRPTALDLAMQNLVTEVRLQLRRAITDTMMTLALPSGVVLRLGKDLSLDFPESLRQITNPELLKFLQKHNLSIDSLRGSGALDWADLPERLHFILDLFRCYEERADLFDPPFSQEQVRALNEGRVPEGRL
ncbi:MAG TPA: hypothetical protein VN452_03780 [Longilinea sp.]|nr:hypothetical protein [Longilinea sp.]